ncbi:MAG: hypothetical protein MRERC_1c138 [Mycoplasmataceae bacterium RC_NB112A]|nr:MAG: hypothetical protein MRERC_1c138 [Mycoplasmataceae bacterium RC_NB112A]
MEKKHNSESQNHNFSLQTRIKQLEQERSRLVEELRLAALDGDLSENFDWTATTLQIEKIEKKILILKQKLFTSNQIFAPKIVVYQSLVTKQNKTVRLTDFLVEEEKNNSLSQKEFFPQQVSPTSPLGLALANKKIGENSEVKTKKGSYWIKIIDIREVK